MLLPIFKKDFSLLLDHCDEHKIPVHIDGAWFGQCRNFKFDVTQASTLALTFDEPTNSTVYEYFSISDQDSTGTILSSHEVGSDHTFLTALNSAGTYYVKVEDDNYYDGGQYSLTGSLTNGTSNRETEGNNSLSAADVSVQASSTQPREAFQSPPLPPQMLNFLCKI